MDVTRRTLLDQVVAAATTAVVGVLGLRAMRPEGAPAHPTPPGPVTHPTLTDEQVLVPRPGGGVHVLSRRCTHLGCRVDLAPDGSSLECPCHGSRFDLQGRRRSGPAAGDLPRVQHEDA